MFVAWCVVFSGLILILFYVDVIPQIPNIKVSSNLI